MNSFGSKEYVQVGYTALRDPKTGGYCPAVPMYVRTDECDPDALEQLTEDLGQLFALRMKAYRDGCEKAGVAI